MQKFTLKFERVLRSILPSPFSIALLLSVICFGFILFFQRPVEKGLAEYSHELLVIWSEGIWSEAGLVFLVQMMLMLILGHILALSPVVQKGISFITNIPKNNASAAAITCIATMVVSFFNWGLGLIFGAILAKSMHESLSKRGIKHNYPLLAACGYVGLMVWHGGLSGSSLIKVAEPRHLSGFTTKDVPNFIGIENTVFSTPNILCWIALLLLIPLTMYLLGKQNIASENSTYNTTIAKPESIDNDLMLAEKIENNKLFSFSIGLGLLICLALFVYSTEKQHLFTPNNLNFLLLSLCLLFTKNLHTFLNNLNGAMKDGAGILIQFPLYFGIMALMKETGFAANLAQFFVSNANATTFPLLTLVSSGIINIFIPSGGGQWLVQAPILIESCLALNIPLEKGIMALAYGDQLTNMLQPFWALPLLGITGLKAQKIFPYTLVLFVLGLVIFSTCIFLW